MSIARNLLEQYFPEMLCPKVLASYRQKRPIIAKRLRHAEATGNPGRIDAAAKELEIFDNEHRNANQNAINNRK